MKTISQELLYDDFFLVSDGERSLVYSPLRRIVFEVLPKGLEEIRRRQEIQDVASLFEEMSIQKKKVLTNRVGSEYKPTRLVLSLTSNCNLRCVYCYAEAGKKNLTMPWSIAKEAIDETIKNLQEKGEKSLKVTFHGGGEPFVAFPLMKRCVEYICSVWEGQKDFSVVTNGTLITSEIADWLQVHQFRLTISLDGPPEIQNIQRPKVNGDGSYDDAIRGARFLQERRMKFGIRATVTKSNVFKINDLLEIAMELGCGLKLEPLTPVGRGVNSEILTAEDFFEQYSHAQVRAATLGVPLKSTYSSDFNPKCIFCAGDGEMFCVLPDGRISSCSRVTKEDDALADTFLIGNIGSEGLSIDPEKVVELRQFNVMLYGQCEGCFAKWYCAGGCHNTRLLNSGIMPEEHCNLEKQFLWSNLVRELESEKKGGEKNG